jgi:two-component system, cell cycle response regulator
MKKVLIIEDDQKLQNMYKNMLAHEGFETCAADNGPQGLEILSHTPCTLILLDIMLPGGMNGFDVLMRLQQNEATKHIPVIVMTNLDSERKTALDMGAYDYVVKADTDQSELMKKIKRAIPDSQA